MDTFLRMQLHFYMILLTSAFSSYPMEGGRKTTKRKTSNTHQGPSNQLAAHGMENPLTLRVVPPLTPGVKRDLFTAIERGDVEKVMNALAHFERPDVVVDGEQTRRSPLHTAIYHGHGSIVRSLLADERYTAGIPPTARTNYGGVNPMHAAAALGNLPLLRVLLEYERQHGLLNSNNSTRNGETLFSFAIARFDLSMVEEILEAGAYVNLPSTYEQEVSALNNGGTVDCSNLQPLTALQNAVGYAADAQIENQEIANAIVLRLLEAQIAGTHVTYEYSTDIALPLAGGRSLLHHIALGQADNAHLMKIFLEHIDPALQDENHMTALDYARQSRHTGIIALLSAASNTLTLQRAVASAREAPVIDLREDSDRSPVQNEGRVAPSNSSEKRRASYDLPMLRVRQLEGPTSLFWDNVPMLSTTFERFVIDLTGEASERNNVPEAPDMTMEEPEELEVIASQPAIDGEGVAAPSIASNNNPKEDLFIFNEEASEDCFIFNPSVTSPIPEEQFLNAVISGDEALIKELVQKLSNPHLVHDPLGRSALHLAILHGHNTIVTLLLRHYHGKKHMVMLPDNQGNTPLHSAVGTSALTHLLTFIDSHGQTRVPGVLNDRNYAGETPLYRAVEQGNMNDVYSLLWERAAVNIPNTEGISPIQRAFIRAADQQSGQLRETANRIAKMLLDPFLERRSKNISTSRKYTQQTLKTLVDREGRTLLHLVARGIGDNNELLLVLLQHIDPNVRDSHGRTALHEAVAHNNRQIVRALLDDVRIDASITDGQGLRPFNIAINNGHLDLARLLTSLPVSTLNTFDKTHVL